MEVRVEPGVAGLRLLHLGVGGSPDADIGSGAENYVVSRLRLKDDVLRPCVGCPSKRGVSCKRSRIGKEAGVGKVEEAESVSRAEDEAMRQTWQQRLDRQFPDGADCFVGEKEYQIQCPRPIVVGIEDDCAGVLLWDFGEQTSSTVVELDPSTMTNEEPGIWRTSRVIMSSHLPPKVVALLAPYRADVRERPLL